MHAPELLEGVGDVEVIGLEQLLADRERVLELLPGREKGEILRENRTMISMCEALGFSVKSSPDDESIAVVTLPVAGIEEASALPGQ